MQAFFCLEFDPAIQTLSALPMTPSMGMIRMLIWRTCSRACRRSGRV